MLGSSSYSSEEDRDHERSSPLDLPQPQPQPQPQPRPPLRLLDYQRLLTSSSNIANTTTSAALPSSSSVVLSSTPPTLLSTSPQSSVIHPRQLLVTCAELISRSEFFSANRLLSLISTDFALQFGDSTERLVYYFCIALRERINRHLLSTTTCVMNPSINIPVTLAHQRPIFSSSSPQIILPNQIPRPSRIVEQDVTTRYSSYLSLNQVTPFIRFTHLTANQAILEAVEGYSSIHILDMNVMHGVQWPPLLQAIMERSSTLGRSCPTIRITGAARDPSLLDRTGDRLRRFAESLGLEFEFCDLILYDSEVVDHSEAVIHALMDHRLRFDQVKEALAINCGDYLHCLLREYDTRSLRRFLHKVKTLNPKVLTLGEREADHNHPLFLGRFVEALDHYGAVFDSLEATLPPQSRERVAVEEAWFGEEIKDVVGEDGERRKDRHQRFESWEIVMRSSGFKSLALSPFSLSQAKLLLRLHYPSEGYQLQVVKKNCLFLGWKNRPLYSVSSWQ
ncbi:scarecrow-like protein 18 [Chenopodium quinoa]|uniref:scarecrow-like protein 18 n=1 Tax=Chenopodium quinoa TaxID=63459 RepID=UPI000B773549|nr:scarecrow-like protein 18 [Chenopodium quinoa]